MFILFGWGHKANKDFGPTMPVTCPRCNNDTYWRLLRSRTWFTLFFIPVIPYENKHFLLCEVCQNGVQLHGEDIEKAKYLTNATQQYLNKEINEATYQHALDTTNLWQKQI